MFSALFDVLGMVVVSGLIVALYVCLMSLLPGELR